MNVEIISVGNEVVYGHTINTNASYIAQKVQQVGLLPRYVTAVCDDAKDITEALTRSLERAKVILITGGLGPTADDLTKETVCAALGKTMVIKPCEVEKIKKYFERINRPMVTINEKQAAFPEEAQILPNDCGTAPGCILDVKGQKVILLPGPPKEMKVMFENYVMPILKTETNTCVETLDIHCFGIGESELATRLGLLLGEFSWGSVATYVGQYEVIVRITAYEGETARHHLEEAKNEVEKCLEYFVIGYNGEKLEEKIVQLLTEKKMTISTVESCTGGLVAATLINCSGVSSCLREGIITYSNDAKRHYVEVQEETLRCKGAVSEETAREMAEGIRRVTKAEIGLATTGIAGPGGGSEDKPVGLVYIGIAMPQGTDVFKLQLSGSRQEVREKTVKNILFKLYKKLK